jgi:Glycosyl transferase family 2
MHSRTEHHLSETPRQASQPDEVELTILMPCLDEAETIEVCVRKASDYLQRAGVVGEVLVADNGSTDGSQDLARAAGARVVAIADKGYGAALIGGINAARGRYIIMGDADDSYDFSDLDGFVSRLREGYQLVMGNRFRGGIAPGAMPPLHRYLGNPVLSFVGRLFYSVSIGDFHCGLRGFNRDAALGLGLQCPGMEFASELVVKARLHKLRITEVPTTLSPDGRSRPPHLRSWRDGWRHLRFLLLFSPRWLFLVPGAILFGVGLLLTAMIMPRPLRIGDLTLDVFSLVVASAMMLVGMQMLTFGWLARVYAQKTNLFPVRQRRVDLHALEIILLVALALVALGAIGLGYAVVYWLGQRHPIDVQFTARLIIPSVTGMALGVQIALAGFMRSVLDLKVGEDFGHTSQ